MEFLLQFKKELKPKIPETPNSLFSRGNISIGGKYSSGTRLRRPISEKVHFLKYGILGVSSVLNTGSYENEPCLDKIGSHFHREKCQNFDGLTPVEMPCERPQEAKKRIVGT